MAQALVDLAVSSAKSLREYEIEEARTIQQAMVPLEPLRGHSAEYICKFRPVAEVGGDFLDFFWLSDRRLGFYLGDVVGKGLPAALYGALVVGTLRGINKTGEAPTSVLELLNRRLRMRVTPGRYCAVQYGVFDPVSRVLRYANAAVPRPIHISPRGCRELGEGGLPSGLFEDASYDEYTAQLSPGDSVLFTTDGLIEAYNPAGEEFGAERLIAVCAENRKAPGGTLLANVFAAVDAFSAGVRQHDDMTAALLKLE